MANLTNSGSLIPYADKALSLTIDNLDQDGWLQHTVDPYVFDTPSASGSHSPEGQAFVLLLQAAWSSVVKPESPALLAL
jgi:hypothetical protein